MLEKSHLPVNTAIVLPNKVQKDISNRSNGFQITASQNKAQKYLYEYQNIQHSNTLKEKNACRTTKKKKKWKTCQEIEE